MRVKKGEYLYTFIDMLLPATRLPEAEKYPTDETHTWVFGYVAADRARLVAVSLENLVVLIG